MSAASTDWREQDRLDAVLFDELRDRVHARLRQRRREHARRRRRTPSRRRASRPAPPARETPEPTSTPATSPAPSCAAFESTRERALLDLVAVMLEEDEDAHRSRFSARNSRICSAALPSSSIVRVSPRGGGSESASTSVREPCSPGLRRVDAELGERDLLLRLLLRAHDPLQRRVARLVDRVGDGDDGRQRRADDVVAELGLALARERAVRRASARRPARSTGRRSRSATAAQRTAPSESDDCCPKSTRSALLALERLASTALVATRSEPAAPSSVTRTARSAPIASAFRSELSARSRAHREDDDLALAGRRPSAAAPPRPRSRRRR